MKPLLQFKQLGFKVIQSETPIVILTPLRQRIGSIVKRAVQAATDVKATGDSWG
ncbi:hypothetical protein [Serratia oryzae]|uniref:hypothetical protein n=1 Tax=Serratia oryzae TaxID=2034155 RepID=UPI0012E14992|nr:hypothetical protein [Serratia oryzae]